jgi:hypothetical protein
MGLLKQTGTYIFKREAYRGYRHVAKHGLPSWSLGIFEIIGAFVLLALFAGWVINDGLPMIFAILSAWFCFMMIQSLIRYIRKTKPIYKTVPVYRTDRRYKLGVRQVDTKTVKAGRVALSEKEINYQKSSSIALAKKRAILGVSCAAMVFITGLIPPGYISKVIFKKDSITKNKQ